MDRTEESGVCQAGRAYAERLIDAHQHFLDPARHSYPWLTDELAAIRRTWSPRDLEPEIVRENVVGTVLVQTVHTADESLEFLSTAAATPWIVGVVGWVDLLADDVVRQINALLSARGGETLVGIRHGVHDEPNPNWLLDPAVLRGLSAVQDAGLTFDLEVDTREMPVAAQVAGRLPKLTFVLDHLGKPPIASGWSEEWAEGFAALAAQDNVVAKVSGLVTEADHERWQPDDLGQVVAYAVEMFTAERLLFGSDWPVCRLAATYGEVVASTRQALGSLAADPGVFATNAKRVYGLTKLP